MKNKKTGMLNEYLSEEIASLNDQLAVGQGITTTGTGTSSIYAPYWVTQEGYLTLGSPTQAVQNLWGQWPAACASGLAHLCYDIPTEDELLVLLTEEAA